LSSIPFYQTAYNAQTEIYTSLHLLMPWGRPFRFGLLQIKLLWTFVYEFFNEHVFMFFSKCLGHSRIL
jgi:hypothetical protein